MKGLGTTSQAVAKSVSPQKMRAARLKAIMISKKASIKK